MNNFYPGPSKLYPQVKEWLTEIYDSGILSKNHRSDAFMRLWTDTEAKLKTSLNVPDEYEVYVTSSATECWEIVNQSLISGNTSYAYNGSFGKKWANYYATNNKLLLNQKGLRITERTFGIDEELPISSLQNEDTICLTHNETSNGTFLGDTCLLELRKQNPNALIAIDATSSMAGVSLPWQSGDAWFASVQKCFGLPSGLAVLIVSQRAIKRAEALNDKAHYNSLLNIRANFLKNQTPYTPNILGIALLNKRVEFVEKMEVIDAKIRHRANDFYNFIETQTAFDLLIKNESVRSPTVITIKVEPAEIQRVTDRLKVAEIEIGKGYGEWKESTFRVANFPAITDAEFEYLKKNLR